MSVSARRDDERVTELALAAGRGDMVAYEAWVRQTQADVWRFLVHLGGPDNADDLTQETYARAVTALPRFAGRSSARTWLLSIARRVMVDSIRHASARPRMSGQDWEQIAETAPDPGTVSATFEGAIDIRLLIETLDTERREALVLTQILGYSYAEAAQVCGCPVGTIRSRVARARTDLVQRMTDGAPELGNSTG